MDGLHRTKESHAEFVVRVILNASPVVSELHTFTAPLFATEFYRDSVGFSPSLRHHDCRTCRPPPFWDMADSHMLKH